MAWQTACCKLETVDKSIGASTAKFFSQSDQIKVDNTTFGAHHWFVTVVHVFTELHYRISEIYCEKKYLQITILLSEVNICNFWLLLYLQQEIHRRYMNPKSVLALILVNACEIVKFAKLKTGNEFPLYGMLLYNWCNSVIMIG